MTTLFPAAVFFDAYGTLIHYPETPSPFDYMADVMRRLGYTIPRVSLDAALKTEMGYYKAHFSSVQSEIDLNELRASGAKVYVDALSEWVEGHSDLGEVAQELASACQTRMLPGAESAIDVVWRSGVRAGVLSNFAYMLPLVLAEVGLRNVLDPIVVSASVGYEKPDPRIFAAAAAAVDAVHPRPHLLHLRPSQRPAAGRSRVARVETLREGHRQPLRRRLPAPADVHCVQRQPHDREEV